MARPTLKLVETQITDADASPHRRPYATYYFGPRAKPSDWCARGRAASLRGAVRAAVTRLLDRRAHDAVIHDEWGVVVARIQKVRNSIRILGVFTALSQEGDRR